MRILRLAVFLLSTSSFLLAAGNNQFLKFTEQVKQGKVHILAQNVSGKPIVAYVVVQLSDASKTTYHGVYTGGDSLLAGSTIDIGMGSAGSSSSLVLDYVRLSDGATWGDASSDEAKEVAVRFQK